MTCRLSQPTLVIACILLCIVGWLLQFVTRVAPCEAKGPEYWTSQVHLFPIPGDVDRSGLVDSGDFLLVLTNWGANGCECEDTDICLSGETGAVDMIIVLLNWGRESTPEDYAVVWRCWQAKGVL